MYQSEAQTFRFSFPLEFPRSPAGALARQDTRRSSVNIGRRTLLSKTQAAAGS